MKTLHDVFLAFCYIVGILAMAGITLGLIGGLLAMNKKNKR
jgi:hypothetical protein